jgi:PAS domain S-box-containing protein
MSGPALRRNPLGLIVIVFGLLSAGIAVGGYAYYRRESRIIHAQRYLELQAVSALKVDQIVTWRNERLGDARLAVTRIGLRSKIAAWISRPTDSSLKAVLLQDLAMIRDLRGYENVFLASPEGHPLLWLDPLKHEGEGPIRELGSQALREAQPILGDFFRCPGCGQVHLDLAAPVVDRGRPMALLFFRSDPERHLFPLIQSWPLPSGSAETLLARRDGESVLFLNRLRHNPSPALTFRIPITRSGVPAVQAMLGGTGEFQGLDYRGVEVLADLRSVPGSPWYMIAKVDAREILAESRYRGGVILALVGMGVLVFAALSGFLFYLGQARLYEALFRAQRFADDPESPMRNLWLKRSRLFSRVAGFLSATVGGLVLVGWSLDQPTLKGLLPGFVTMKANTAVGFLLAGAGLGLLAWDRSPSRIAKLCAGALFMLGVLSLTQYLLGVDLHIDQLLFQEAPGAIGTLAPGRMAPATALCFILFGAALILAASRRTAATAQWLAVPLGLIGLLSLLSYPFASVGQHGLGHYLQLALHTSATLILLCLGLFHLNPTEGFMKRLMAESMGGWLLRAMVVCIPVVAILIGWAWALGERQGWYESALGGALVVTSFAVLMLAATWWAARSLDRIDAIRSQAERRMREGAEEIRATLYGIGDGVIVTDAEGQVVHMNPVAEHLTGWGEAEAIGMPLEEVFRILDEDTRLPAANPMKSVLREGRVVELAAHVLLVAKDGTMRAIADSGAPVFDERGRITRVVLVFRDQTAERASQRALVESEAKYRRLHESLRDAYAQVDLEGRIVEYNRVFQEMLGHSDEELRRLTVLDITPPEWHEMESRIIREEVLLFGSSRIYEKAYCRKDGTVFPVELRVNLLHGDAGEPIGMWAVVRDISERKASLQRLREAEERLKFALEGSNDGWWDVRMDTGAVSLSPRTCELLGFPPEAGDRIAAKWSAMVHPDDLGPTRDVLEDYLEGRRVLFSVEQRLRTSTGGWKWILTRGKSVAWDESGKALRMVGTHTDISDRKEAERIIHAKTALLNLTGQMARVAGWEFDTTESKGTWTEEVARIYDLDPDQGINFELGFNFFTEESLPKATHAMQQAITDGKPYDLELEIVSAKGIRKTVRTVGLPVQDEAGRVIRLRGILQDITEFKAAQLETQRLLEIADHSRKALLSLVEDQRVSEEEIRRLNADLEQRVESRTLELAAANKELEAFAYSASHDLRAPLRHMDGFLALLKRHLGEGLDEKGAHYLDVAHRAAVRMEQLVDGLLSFSRLGRTELRVVAIDTVQMVNAVIEEFREEIADREIHWTVGRLPRLQGDPTLMRLVFQNLLGNAIKFTRDQAKAEIEILPLDGLTGECGLMVRDNGVGFDPTYGHKLFKVFQRLHREDEFEGTGIGLANVHRIVSRHGGRGWAEGRPGQGATFFIAFPEPGRES